MRKSAAFGASWRSGTSAAASARWLLASASVAAIAASSFLAGPACAEAAAKPEAASSATVDEVIVTATRREESLQDVPVSVSAFTERVLKEAGAQQMRNLSAPNFLFPQTYTSSRNYISVRGVFQEANTMAFESGFSTYLDGVYMGRNMSYNADVGDIERVEILRGPQGTLFGKNTIGGVMNIVSRRPGPDFEGHVETQIGNWDLLRVRAGANVPIVKDVLSTRFSVQVANRDGYVDNLPSGGERGGGIDMKSGRAQVLFTPNEKLTVHASVDYVRSHNVGYTWETVGAGPLADTTPFTNLSDVVPQERLKDLGASLTSEYEFGDGYKLTAISGYRKSSTRWLEDEDGSPLDTFSSDNRDRQRLWSQELRLNSPTDKRYDYVVGLYYFDQKGAYDFRIPVVHARTILYNGVVDTKSFAAFAHGNFHVTDQLNFFAGLRYTNEKKDFVGNRLVLNYLYASPNFINPPVPQFVSAVDADKISWTAGVQYHVNDDVMVYASVADGFKSAGFNIRDGVAVKPEYLTSYEAGVKTKLFDNRASLNVTAFYSDYKDLQVRAVDFATRVSTLRNAASVRAKGFEVEFVARPTDRLTLNLGVGYVDSKFHDFRTAQNVFGVDIDASGNHVPMTPPWTVNASAHYEYPLASGANLVAHVDYVYVDDRYGVLDAGQNGPGFALDAYGVVNGRIGYRSPDKKWEVFAWAKNLTNELTETDRRTYPAAPGTVLQFATYLEPRTYGVTLAVDF